MEMQGTKNSQSVCLQCRRPGVWSLGQEDPLEKEMANHSSTLVWKIPWRAEPGRLQSMGSQRVGHDWVTSLQEQPKTMLKKKRKVGELTTSTSIFQLQTFYKATVIKTGGWWGCGTDISTDIQINGDSRINWESRNKQRHLWSTDFNNDAKTIQQGK